MSKFPVFSLMKILFGPFFLFSLCSGDPAPYGPQPTSGDLAKSHNGAAPYVKLGGIGGRETGDLSEATPPLPTSSM